MPKKDALNETGISLSFNDRITIMSILPETGNILEIKSSRRIQSLVEITEKEVKDTNFSIKRGDAGKSYYSRDNAKEKEIKIAFNETDKEIIKGCLISLNDQKKLQANNSFIKLYDEFVK